MKRSKPRSRARDTRALLTAVVCAGKDALWAPWITDRGGYTLLAAVRPERGPTRARPGTQ